MDSTSASHGNHADVGSIDGIINAAYHGISGRAGKKRDWDRERSRQGYGAARHWPK